MSFPGYDAYRMTGKRWLDAVPASWDWQQSRRLFALRDERARSGDVQLTASQKHGIVTQEDFVTLEGRRVMEVIKGADILKHVEPGDFVISMRSFEGGLECSRVRGSISSAYVMLIPSKRVHGPFFKYLFKSTRYVQALQSTTNLVRDGQALRYNNFTQIDLPVPPAAEQICIARFLSAEAAKIDALIAEQQRLIALLSEKRQAVISHAVTKGLNSDSPMKPSGVEWLGDIPEHWALLPLKRDLAYVTSGSRGWAAQYSDDGELFIRIANLTRDSVQIDLRDIQRVTVPAGTEGVRTRVRDGDVLFSITAYLGSVAVVTDSLEPAYVSQHVALARLRANMLTPRWVGYVALSVVGRTWFDTQSYGGTKIQLSLDDIRSLPVPTPPADEQLEIVALIERELAKLDQLREAANRAIALLQERRTALISAAVTGQIDVRGYANVEVA